MLSAEYAPLGQIQPYSALSTQHRYSALGTWSSALGPVIEGHIRVFLRDPAEEIRLGPGETYSVRARRPHLVTNGGDTSATFLVLQGIGEYDYVPLP